MSDVERKMLPHLPWLGYGSVTPAKEGAGGPSGRTKLGHLGDSGNVEEEDSPAAGIVSASERLFLRLFTGRTTKLRKFEGSQL